MKEIILAGTTSKILQIFIADSSSTTGAGLTGLTNASSGLTAYFHRDNDTTATAISLVTMTVGTFTSSGFKEIDATNMPGWYQFCPPNTALASGAKSCAIHLKGATNMAPLPIEIQLTAMDFQDAVHGGMSALPNTACTTNASLLTSGTGTDQLHVSSGHITNVDTLTTYTGNTVQTGDAYARLGAPAGASTAADIAAIKSETDTILTDVNTGGGAIYTRLGAPAGASIAADIAAAKVDTAAIKVQTDKMTFTVANQMDSHIVSVAGGASNIKKNQALSGFEFVMTDSTTHAPKTGLTVTATRSLDGAAFGACANSVTEIANGWYTINLAAADLNGNNVALRFTGTGADDCDILIITQP